MSGDHHSRLGKMPLGGRIPLIGGNVFGDILLVVVAGFVSRQRQQPDQRDRARRGENGRGPPNDRGADPPPSAGPDLPLGLEQTETASDSKNCRNQRKRDRDRDQYAHRARDAQGLEIGQPGKAQAENRSGDSQAGSQDNLSDPAVCGVVSRFPILAGLTRLLIPTEEEYPVVRSSRDPDGYQQTNGVGSKTNNLVDRRETRRFLGPPAILCRPSPTKELR